MVASIEQIDVQPALFRVLTDHQHSSTLPLRTYLRLDRASSIGLSVGRKKVLGFNRVSFHKEKCCAGKFGVSEWKGLENNVIFK